MQESEIKIRVSLDENHVPEKIVWQADDAGNQHTEAKGAMLTIWDKAEHNTLRVDLWTKEMTVEEMRFFCCQTLLTLPDTFLRATGDNESAQEMAAFAKSFALKMGVLKKENS